MGGNYRKKMEEAAVARVAKMERELFNYKAQDVMTLKLAHVGLGRIVPSKYMASGVIVTITDLSGKMLVEPVMISDGLSAVAVRALQDDVKRTFDLRVALANI